MKKKHSDILITNILKFYIIFAGVYISLYVLGGQVDSYSLSQYVCYIVFSTMIFSIPFLALALLGKLMIKWVWSKFSMLFVFPVLLLALVSVFQYVGYIYARFSIDIPAEGFSAISYMLMHDLFLIVLGIAFALTLIIYSNKWDKALSYIATGFMIYIIITVVLLATGVYRQEFIIRCEGNEDQSLRYDYRFRTCGCLTLEKKEKDDCLDKMNYDKAVDMYYSKTCYLIKSIGLKEECFRIVKGNKEGIKEFYINP